MDIMDQETIDKVSTILSKHHNVSTSVKAGDFEPITAGYSNEVYKLVAGGEKFVLKKKVNKLAFQAFEKSELKAHEVLYAQGFGPEGLFEDDDLCIEHFVENRALAPEEARTLPVLLSCFHQVALFSRAFMRPEVEHRFSNPHKCLLSVIIDCEQGLEKATQKVREICGLPGNELYQANSLQILQFLEQEAVTDFAMQFRQSLDHGPMFICHNDAHPGNILVKPDGSLMLLDYEFAAYSPIGWDLAVYFVEMCYSRDEKTGHFSVQNTLPNRQDRELFFKSYLLSLNGGIQERNIFPQNLIDYIRAGKFDYLIDLDLHTKLSSDEYFYGMAAAVNLMFIISGLSSLKQPVSAELLAYRLRKIELQRLLNNIIKEL